MSLEALLAENTASMNALALALAAQTAVTERVVAGQAAAMAKLPDGGGTTTGRKTKAEKEAEAAAAKAAAGNDAPAATDNGAAAAGSASNLPTGVTDAETLKAHIGVWTSAVEGDDRAKRVGLLKVLAAHFGPDGDLKGFAHLAAKPDRLKQTLFFIERAKLGLLPLGDDGALKSALLNDFDFDGPVDQGAEAEDEFA